MPVPRSARGRHRAGRAGEAGNGLRTGIIIFMFFLLAAGAVTYFLVWAGRENVKLGADLCPDDASFRPPKLIVILFDQTDQLSAAHHLALTSRFKEFLDREFASADAQSKWRFSRIEFHSFAAKPKTGELEIRRTLALCNPGGVDGLTKFHSNPNQVRRNFEQQFLARIESELTALRAFKESQHSPIFEAIKYVGLAVFADPKYRNSEKLLLMVSDLLHNTSDLRMHGVQPRFEEFYRSAYGNRMIADLRRATVELWVLEFPAHVLAQRALANFWGLYFERSNAVPDGYKWIR